jgi:tetratricopeptide (TPR) repeat protein
MTSPARFFSHPAFAYALLCAAAFFVYHNVYHNAFIFDDEILLEENRYLRHWKYLSDIFLTSSTSGFGGTDSFYRPLQIFIYMLTYMVFGLSLPAFHALNITFHLGSACLMYRLGQKLGFEKYAALAASFIWVIHPLHTEAVTYMSATADPAHVFFILLGCLCWLSALRYRLPAALACFTAALLFKEAAVVFPAMLCVISFFYPGNLTKLRAILSTWPVWLLAIIYLVLRATLLNFDNSYSFYNEKNPYTEDIFVRFYTFVAVLPDYFRLIILPQGLHMERWVFAHGSFFNVPVLIGFLLLCILGLIVFLGFNKKYPHYKPLAFGLIWFFAAHFPCSGILLPMNALFLEHWMYLPTIGLFLGIGQFTVTAIKMETPRIISFALLCVYAGFLCMGTIDQNKVWAGPYPFYQNILKYERGSTRVHNNLAMYYEEQGKTDLAEEHYLKSFIIWDVYPQNRYNYANLLSKRGQLEEAIVQYKRALELDPTFYRAAYNLAQIYKTLGRRDRAKLYFGIYRKYVPKK